MKKKKLFITLWVLFVVVIVVTFAFVIPMINILPMYIEYKSFDDIAEFAFVEEVAEEILTPDTDKDIKNIAFTESKAYRIKYNGAIFNIYAYVFEDNDDANNYFRNAAGKKNNRETNFSSSGNYYFSTRLTVLSNNKAYKITGPGYKEFMKFIEIVDDNLSGPKIYGRTNGEQMGTGEICCK